MPDVTFDLQVVTPLFLAGVNQQEIVIDERDQKSGERTTAWEFVPEIRSPSFRGLMRYWLRAAVAGLANTQVVGFEKVREFEKSIFGATDEASAIRVRVKTISETVEKFKKESYSQEQISGRDYLYWSMAKSGKGNNYKPTRQYFSGDTKFSLTLSVHGQDDTQLRKLQCAVAAFWLLTSLGGIGSRSRRCAGSLAVTNISGSIPLLSFAEARNVQELQRILRQGIQEVRRIYTAQLAEMTEAMGNIKLAPLQGGSFDTLTLPDFCRIWILQRRNGGSGFPWPNIKGALSDIGQELQAYRRNIWPLEKRTSFGLPLIVQQMRDSKLKEALKENRRASPLLLKVSKLQGEQYVGVAVLFKTRYEAAAGLPQPDYTLIEEWIEKNLKRMTVLEVLL